MRALVSFFSSSSVKEGKRRPKCQSAVCRIFNATSSCASNGFIRERTPRQESEWCRVLGTGVNEFFRAISRIPHRRGSEAVRSRLATGPFLLGSYELSRQPHSEPQSRTRYPVCPQPCGEHSLR